jgi:hypothetical protein
MSRKGTPVRQQSGGGIWLVVAVALVLLLPPDPSTAARPSADDAESVSSGRAARVSGLAFTDGAGCRPSADWHSPQLDRRVRTLLEQAARREQIRVSCLHTGHTMHVRGTRRVSNHYVWRAVDIDRVAGRPVGPGNPVAKQLALAIGRGELGVQPSEVGSPWSFGARPWFTDAHHQGHLHVGFR